MRTRAVAILAVGMWLGWPAADSACDFYLAYTFLGAQSASFAIGGGSTFNRAATAGTPSPSRTRTWPSRLAREGWYCRL